jgi:hypothetical protein
MEPLIITIIALEATSASNVILPTHITKHTEGAQDVLITRETSCDHLLTRLACIAIHTYPLIILVITMHTGRGGGQIVLVERITGSTLGASSGRNTVDTPNNHILTDITCIKSDSHKSSPSALRACGRTSEHIFVAGFAPGADGTCAAGCTCYTVANDEVAVVTA